jgi:hypothetical protein
LSASTDDRGTIVSSRSIDMYGRLVQNGDDAGSFAGMNDTRQRVMILCALAGAEPLKQTSDFEATTRARLRTALLPLTASKPPVIKVLEIRVEQFPNGTKKLVRYRDLTDGAAYEAEV